MKNAPTFPRRTAAVALPLAVVAAALLLAACAGPAPAVMPKRVSAPYFGMHAIIDGKVDAQRLMDEMPALAARGVNLIVAEINYNFEYVSHPDLRTEDPVSKAYVRRLVKKARSLGIRMLPEFQSLGHQSWDSRTFPLLVKHPEFDETPGAYPGNKDIYCRSWCPLHPGVMPIVADLIDELIDAFQADAVHVGMDEVFLIGEKECPRCAGKDKAELFAKAVNDLHAHIVGKRGLEMWMWGDRFIDGNAGNYGEWEAAKNGTAPAVDRVPKDIVICDWHYEPQYEEMKTYGFPSVKMFLDKGFRVLPTSYRDPVAVAAFIDASRAVASPKMLGHMCTLWHGFRPGDAKTLPQLQAAEEKLRQK